MSGLGIPFGSDERSPFLGQVEPLDFSLVLDLLPVGLLELVEFLLHLGRVIGGARGPTQ